VLPNSTFGKVLAEHLGCKLYEGDDFHGKTNVGTQPNQESASFFLTYVGATIMLLIQCLFLLGVINNRRRFW
jgi:hypothetical protein